MDLRWSGAALKSEESDVARRDVRGGAAGRVGSRRVVYNERGKERRGSNDDDGGWDTQVRGKERRYIWGQRMDRTEY